MSIFLVLPKASIFVTNRKNLQIGISELTNHWQLLYIFYLPRTHDSPPCLPLGSDSKMTGAPLLRAPNAFFRCSEKWWSFARASIAFAIGSESRLKTFVVWSQPEHVERESKLAVGPPSGPTNDQKLISPCGRAARGLVAPAIGGSTESVGNRAALFK